MAVEPMDVDSLMPSSSQGPRSALDDSNATKLETELVRYLLFKQCERIPIKRSDIVKDVFLNNRKSFDQVMQKAQRDLRNIYGMEVVTIPRDRTDASSTNERSKGSADKRYVLRNTLELDKQSIISNPHQVEDYGLLTIILAIIFMTGGTVKEVDLLERLQTIVGCDRRRHHNLFGDISKKFDQFVKEMYLNRHKELINSEYVSDYSWGERSEVEVNKLEVLQFVSELMHVPVESWTSQYQQATEQ